MNDTPTTSAQRRWIDMHADRRDEPRATISVTDPCHVAAHIDGNTGTIRIGDIDVHFTEHTVARIALLKLLDDLRAGIAHQLEEA